jgi:hypothetical protein
MANGRVSFGLRDSRNKLSSFELEVGAVTAVSLPGLLTQIGTLRTAVDAVTLDTLASEHMSVFDTKLSNAIPTNSEAQNGKVWVVQYEDNQQFFDPPVNAIPNEGYQKIFTRTLPGADYSLLDTNPGVELDELDITAGPGLTLVNAIEAMARSPYGGTVNVLRIYADGRNR